MLLRKLTIYNLLGFDLFDQLDNVKTAWNENRVVMLQNSLLSSSIKEKITLVAPTSIITSHMLKQIRDYGGANITVNISYALCKTLELPFMRTVYRAVASRYPIIDYFMSQETSNSEISNSAYSLTIDSVETEFGNTFNDVLKTVQQVGKLIDGFHNHELKQNEFVAQFRKSFKVPGHVPVIRSSLHQLKGKVSITELSLALCQVAKFPLTAVISDMIDPKTGIYLTIEKAKTVSSKHNIPIIDTKTVINLWRSILKVPKNDIAEY